jgi:hypothetical protein
VFGDETALPFQPPTLSTPSSARRKGYVQKKKSVTVSAFPPSLFFVTFFAFVVYVDAAFHVSALAA